MDKVRYEISSLGTHIKVADIIKSKDFYESLGFKPIFAYGDDKFRALFGKDFPTAQEKYRGVTFKVGENAELEIAEGHIAIKNKGVFKEEITSPKVSAMVKVTTLIPVLENPLVEIKNPVTRYYWGTIEAVFRDPDGYVLVFIAPFSETELKRVSALVEVKDIKSQ